MSFFSLSKISFPRIGVHNSLLYGLGALITLLLLGMFFPLKLNNFFDALQTNYLSSFSFIVWLFVNLALFSLLFIALTPLGGRRIGGRDAKPHFSVWSWLSMLFCAGMGVGLIIYGPAEPLYHLQHVVSTQVAETGCYTAACLAPAIQNSVFHWGAHTWSIYALAGILFAYFHYNKSKPLQASSLVITGYNRGNRTKRAWLETAVIFSIVIGLATTVSVGGSQVATATESIFSGNQQFLVPIILMIGFVAAVSLFGGLKKGLKWISLVNAGMALVLMGIVLLLIFNLDLLKIVYLTTKGYLLEFIPMGLQPKTFLNEAAYQSRTILYWSWWVAWAPFVGLFIAKISYGRTLRQMILGTVFIPTLLTIVWFSVFGIASIHAASDVLLVTDDATRPEGVVLNMLSSFPLEKTMLIFAMLVATIFIITSVNSAAVVIQQYAKRLQNGIPVIFWVILITLLALLLAYFDTSSVFQGLLLLASFPVAFILAYGALRLFRSLYTSLPPQAAVQK